MLEDGMYFNFLIRDGSPLPKVVLVPTSLPLTTTFTSVGFSTSSGELNLPKLRVFQNSTAILNYSLVAFFPGLRWILEVTFPTLCFSSQFHFFCIVMERTKVCHCTLSSDHSFIGSHFEFGLVQIGLDLHFALDSWPHGILGRSQISSSAFFQTKDLVSRHPYSCLLPPLSNDLVQLCADIHPWSSMLVIKLSRLHPLSIYRYRLKADLCFAIILGVHCLNKFICCHFDTCCRLEVKRRLPPKRSTRTAIAEIIPISSWKVSTLRFRPFVFLGADLLL